VPVFLPLRENRQNKGELKEGPDPGYFKKMSRFWKINYDNIKKILILQPAQLSNSLQSYLKTVP